MSHAEILRAPTHARAQAPSGGRNPYLAGFAALTLLMAAALVLAVRSALTGEPWAVALALGLVTVSAVWIAAGAATAILGIVGGPGRPDAPAAGWQPSGSTALLFTLCGEPAAPLARHVADLWRGLMRAGLGAQTQIYILSDTRDPALAAAEEAALADVIASGAVIYRRRTQNIGRKPGNIADWLARWGDDHLHMLVLDADSRMSAGRIRALIHRIDTQPRAGLVQAGMTLVPAQSRFGRHQRVSSRLLSPNFARGFAAWSGKAGNYWGHNAIMRVAAFRSAAALPDLRGPGPFGGAPLSHDFIEAAYIRRAGWDVVLDPDASGSAEDGPQDMETYHRRDRRWCQGNLQHLQILAEPGFDPVSRVHLASGIMGYMAAPIWLLLVALFASSAVTVTGVLPFALVALVLLMPKLCAFVAWLWRARTAGRRAVIVRAAAGELAVSTLLAPLVMVRQTASVLSVLAGRDCGWKSARAVRWRMPVGIPEAAVGMGLVGLMVAGGSAAVVWWILPVALPLILAPAIQRSMDVGA